MCNDRTFYLLNILVKMNEHYAIRDCVFRKLSRITEEKNGPFKRPLSNNHVLHTKIDQRVKPCQTKAQSTPIDNNAH